MRRLPRPHVALLALIVVGGAALLAIGTSKVREWAVMTDEMLYAKLARHIADTGSPLPSLHGEHVGFLGIVYPILLAPISAASGTAGGFVAMHVLNAVLFASAAIPAYLLGRRVTTATGGLIAAALTIAVPWAVNAAFVMSEPAAYPVFLWAVLGLQAAVAQPSRRNDLLAVGGLALAFFTRPQFLFLAVVLPVAAVAVAGPRRALREHRLLAVVYALAIVVVIPLAALGQGHRLLGDYGVTATQGSILPSAVWKSLLFHMDVVAVGVGVLPFLIGLGWTYSSLRDGRTEARAFAWLAGTTVPVLALEASSYDVRFGGASIIRDRYLFYLAPLMFVATVAALTGPRFPWIGVGAATAFFALSAAFADFAPKPGVQVDSAEAVLNGIIHDQSAGLPAGVFVAVCVVVLGVICVALGWLPRGAALAGVALVVFAFGASTAGYAFDRLLTSKTVSGLPVTGQPRVRDWVDRATSHSSVGVIAYPISRDWGPSAVVWWDVEFWNDGVDRAYVVPGGTFAYTPFPFRTLALDAASGRFTGTEHAPPFVLRSAGDTRFGLAGAQTATNQGLVLQQVERPYRVLWTTSGLDPDGWSRPGRPVTVRVYDDPARRTRRIHVTLILDSPPEATGPASIRFEGATTSVAPAGRSTVAADACIPRGGHVDLVLRTGRAATIAGPPIGPVPGPPRVVGPVLSGVQVDPGAGAC
jgi:hypothetical protein